MKNKDIHEWLLDEEIDSLTTIINMKGESIFIADVLEKHLKEQLLQTTVIKSVCKHEYITDADWKSLTCRLCNDRIKPTQTVL